MIAKKGTIYRGILHIFKLFISILTLVFTLTYCLTAGEHWPGFLQYPDNQHMVKWPKSTKKEQLMKFLLIDVIINSNSLSSSNI